MSQQHRHNSSSDEDDDVIVLQVCSNRHCQGIDDLEYDPETEDFYCGSCRALYARTEKEGFHILLSEDDHALVNLIFGKFDDEQKGYWAHEDWKKFQDVTDHPSEDPIDSDEALMNFFQEEYDIALDKCGTGAYVVTIENLEDMYGGYIFNHVDALVEDSEALENGGILDTGVLE